YSRLQLRNPVVLSVDPEELILSTILTDGMFVRQPSTVFRWLVWSTIPVTGEYGVERSLSQGPLERHEAKKLWEEDESRLVAYPGGPMYFIPKSLTPKRITIEEKPPGPSEAYSDDKVLFHAERGGTQYFVMTQSFPSTWPPGPTMCGVGTETQIVWLKINGDSVEKQTEIIESCFSSTESEIEQNADQIVVTGSNFLNGEDFEIVFRKSAPDKKFVVKRTAMKD
ncbi:MAG: hypothetical protein AB1798_22220, partial [Spirochaetota bacterium]